LDIALNVKLKKIINASNLCYCRWYEDVNKIKLTKNKKKGIELFILKIYEELK